MSSEHDRLTLLFERALELSPPARAAFIDASTDDPEMRSELRSLLAVHDRTPNPLERLALDVMPAVLEAVAPDDAVCDAAATRRARPARSKEDLIGTTVAHYLVVSHLGSGGMADVYVAR